MKSHDCCSHNDETADATAKEAPSSGSHHHDESIQPTKEWFCPMCPGVESDRPGSCPKCGMALERNLTFRRLITPTYTCPMHPEVRQAPQQPTHERRERGERGGRGGGGRSFGGGSRDGGGERRSYGDDRPRREGGFNDKPRFDSNDDNRGNRVDYKPRREGNFSDRPKRDFGDRPAPRREGGFGDRPQRSFGDDRPKRTFGGEDRPKRTFGGEDRPKREFNSDRPRTEGGFDRPRRKFND